MVDDEISSKNCSKINIIYEIQSNYYYINISIIYYRIETLLNEMKHTICRRTVDPFNLVTYYINWDFLDV